MNPFEDVAVFIPSYRRMDRLKRCIQSLRKHGYPDGKIYVICHENTDPFIKWPNVILIRIQREGWNEGKAFASCMHLARFYEPFAKYVLIIDDDVVFTGTQWVHLSTMMNYPEYDRVYMATACGDAKAVLAPKQIKQLNADNVCSTSISFGVLMVRTKAVKEVGLFAPTPCRVEYEYKLRLAMVGAVFVCFNLSGFDHIRASEGGTNRLFPSVTGRVGAKRLAFWRFMKVWTAQWPYKERYISFKQNILTNKANRFEVVINWKGLTRMRLGTCSNVWIKRTLRWMTKPTGRYVLAFRRWFEIETAGLL